MLAATGRANKSAVRIVVENISSLSCLDNVIFKSFIADHFLLKT